MKNTGKRKSKFLPKLERKDFIFIFVIILISIVIKVQLTQSVSIHDGEECLVGTIANEINENENPDLFHLSRIMGGGYFYNGRIVDGIITAHMFKIFGVTGHTIKYTYVLQGTILWLICFAFLFRFYGRSTAYVGGLLLTFSFLTLLLLSVSQSGPHLLGALVAIILLYLLFYILEHNLDVKHPIFLVFLFLSLLSVFINYLLTILIIAFTAYMLVLNMKKHAIFTGGLIFIILILSIIFRNIYLGTKAGYITFFYSIFSGNNILTYLESIVKFFFNFDVVLFSPFFKHQSFYTLFLKILAWVIILLIVLFSERSKRNKEKFFLVYYSCFILIYLIFYRPDYNSDLHPLRHVFTFIVFLTLNLSIVITNYKSFFRKKVFLFILFFLLVVNISLNSGFILDNSKAVFPPYCYFSLGFGYEAFTHQPIETCLSLKESYVFDCYSGIRKENQLKDKEADYCQNFEEEAETICEVSYTNYKSSDARVLNNTLKMDGKGKIQSEIRNMNITKEKKFRYLTDPGNLLHNKRFFSGAHNECSKVEDSRLCMLKVSYDLAYSLGDNYPKTEDILCEEYSRELKKFCYFSLGKRIGELNFLNITNAREECSLVSEEYIEYCREGVCNTFNIYKPYENHTFCT